MLVKVVLPADDDKINKKAKSIKLKSIPSFKMKIGYHKYQVIRTIFKEKGKQNNPENQVYTCLVRNDKLGWIQIKDEIIEKRN